MSLGHAPPCASLSVQLAEPLAGTAPEHATRTLLVPHRGAFARDPIESPGLAVSREAIEGALRQAPGSRFHLFASEPGGRFASSILVARTERDVQSVHRFELGAVTDAESLSRMLGEPELGEAIEGPLHLVCTHGKRDACCARLGTALYAAFREIAGERVLKTSHLGGHRFAPVVHSFPRGLCFGRVERAHLEALDREAARGEAFDPAYLRGVFPYDAMEQAALVEHLLSGGALADVAVSREGETVRVVEPSHTRVFRVKRETLEPRPLSCGAAPGEAFRFDAREVRELGAR
jgi:hypothetical protein